MKNPLSFGVLLLMTTCTVSMYAEYYPQYGQAQGRPAPAPYVETSLPRNSMEISQAVNDAFRNDRRVSGYASVITVSTQNNIVTLEGRVDSEAARRRLGDLAQSIPGVYSVVNNIFVSFPTDVNKRIISP